MLSSRTVALLLLVVAVVVAEELVSEKVVKSRIRRCARQFNIAMNFQCRGVPEEECAPFRELFDMDDPDMPMIRERLLEQKCCERRCSLQVLRSLCCFQ
ncbi:hypothetical protein OESDEN_05379 [Oesophagostomum dentatum]|uniref:Uncharacterized protein n=1 Tax=Oesophagostomum dentatum TaxID=61180 RepID=A0A0B1TF26_OESDE|nr:hypothetical protein OESDEN_05379 [Oesophagostomum dentatum]